MSESPGSSAVDRLPSWLIIAIVVVVALVWTVSMVADIFLADYSPPAALHGAMTAVVGGVLGTRFVGNKNESQTESG